MRTDSPCTECTQQSALLWLPLATPPIGDSAQNDLALLWIQVGGIRVALIRYGAAHLALRLDLLHHMIVALKAGTLRRTRACLTIDALQMPASTQTAFQNLLPLGPICGVEACTYLEPPLVLALVAVLHP